MIAMVGAEEDGIGGRRGEVYGSGEVRCLVLPHNRPRVETAILFVVERSARPGPSNDGRHI